MSNFTMLTALDLVPKALAEMIVLMLKVLLTPADVDPTAATALLVAVGSSGPLTLLHAQR